MIRYLPILIELALLLYALVDCIQAGDRRVRNLPKLAWLAIIVLIPFVGPLAWLLAGRPLREGTAVQGDWPVKQPPVGAERPRPLAPDDDPEFLAKLKREREHEDLLRKWEDDLKRREQQLRPDASANPDTDDPQAPDSPVR